MCCSSGLTPLCSRPRSAPLKSLRSTRLIQVFEPRSPEVNEENGGRSLCACLPKSKPLVSMPESDRANVSRDSNRPGTRIEAQPLEPQTGMGGVCAKQLIGSPSRCSNFRWQFVVKLPKLRCGAGDHARLIEIALCDFWIRVWLRGKISFVTVDQRGEARTWPVIAQNTLPLGVNSQLGEKLRKMLEKFFTFRLPQGANCFFDLLRCAHRQSLQSTGEHRNPRDQPRGTRRSPRRPSPASASWASTTQN